MQLCNLDITLVSFLCTERRSDFRGPELLPYYHDSTLRLRLMRKEQVAHSMSRYNVIPIAINGTFRRPLLFCDRIRNRVLLTSSGGWTEVASCKEAPETENRIWNCWLQ
jgi:hypothetical protein